VGTHPQARRARSRNRITRRGVSVATSQFDGNFEAGVNHAKPERETPKVRLQEGSSLRLYRGEQTEGQAIDVTVDRIEHPGAWIKGSSDSLDEGDAIVLEYAIEGGQRYIARGTVEARRPDSTLISTEGGWCRVQDRSFVRVSTYGLEVGVPDPDSTEVDTLPERLSFEVLDVSAGGIRFESRSSFEVESELVCHFELPGQSCYVFPARVARCAPKAGSPEWNEVALEFLGVDEGHRSELLRWIYQEQAKRRHSS